MVLVVWIICAVICGFMAEAKGLNPTGWVIGGVVFGVFAIIVLAFVPSKKQGD